MTGEMQRNVMIAKLMGETAKELVAFLEKVLPPLFKDWWKEAVVDNLSVPQQRRLLKGDTNSISALDLAALLRVFDRNWFQISTKVSLTFESRHYVKEMQTIRNRWAHAGTEGFPVDDVYRDLDTIQRFLTIINPDSDLFLKVRAEKASLLGDQGTTDSRGTKGKGESNQRCYEKDEFSLGRIVSIKFDPSIRGAIVGIFPGKPENRYDVFVDGKIQPYYASQLQVEDRKEGKARFSRCDEFHSYLTALQIRYPGLSTLYSLNAARVDFIPYQFRPVLKFIRSDRPRLLIADGVGVGKTIEAGLILRELQARSDVQSVLVICPRPLVTERKWQIEMRRFEERFNHLDSNALRYCINETDLDGVWPEQYRRAILPYSLFDETLLYGSGTSGSRKRKKGLLDLDPPPRFDLVIVDEAHHIRNQETYSHRAVRFFCDHAQAVVFLTATPIQLGSRDLFVLLNTLRPDLILDQESFEHMAEPNPFINEAVSHARSQETGWETRTCEALDHASATAWGQSILKHNPEFNRIYSRIGASDITFAERVQLITDLESLHTFSGIINRTRRRDIGEFTVRKPETVVVEFTPAQKSLHEELLRVQTEILSRLHGDVNVNFMMTTLRRQAASCLYGLVPLIDDILSRHLDELSWEEADNSEPAPREESVEPIRAQIQVILESAQSLDPRDPKLEALRNIIRDKQALSNNKVMLFSSFRHTLNYLYKHLSEDDFRVGMIHGGTPDEERVELRGHFEQPREEPDSLDLLLFSEIGCEGLDYQFCDCIINYDLPWNPMRVEQRIGRIDRVGQKSESVAIINMITPGTVDADIYERCLVRIGVFNAALGGSEEILGEITNEIKNIADNFALSEEERRSKLQQLADNKIRLIQEQEALEQRQVELFGIRLPEKQLRKEIDDATSFWLSPESIRRLIILYLRQTCGKDQEYILGEKILKTLRLSQEARSRLLRDFQQLPRKNASTWRDWETWLKGSEQHLPLTFESECAMQHPDATFIMPLHPLVKQAAMSLDGDDRIITSLRAQSDAVPQGKYEFAIYKWQFHGIKEDLILQPIASSEIIAPYLGDLLEHAVDTMADEQTEIGSSVWDGLDAEHYKKWSQARANHRQRTQKVADYRKESLSTSHRARVAFLEEQLKRTTDEKLIRMRRSQIESAEADYARHLQGLDIAMEKADITAGPVAYGVLLIEEPR